MEARKKAFERGEKIEKPYASRADVLKFELSRRKAQSFESRRRFFFEEIGRLRTLLEFKSGDDRDKVLDQIQTLFRKRGEEFGVTSLLDYDLENPYREDEELSFYFEEYKLSIIDDPLQFAPRSHDEQSISFAPINLSKKERRAMQKSKTKVVRSRDRRIFEERVSEFAKILRAMEKKEAKILNSLTDEKYCNFINWVRNILRNFDRTVNAKFGLQFTIKPSRSSLLGFVFSSSGYTIPAKSMFYNFPNPESWKRFLVTAAFPGDIPEIMTAIGQYSQKQRFINKQVRCTASFFGAFPSDLLSFDFARSDGNRKKNVGEKYVSPPKGSHHYGNKKKVIDVPYHRFDRLNPFENDPCHQIFRGIHEPLLRPHRKLFAAYKRYTTRDKQYWNSSDSRYKAALKLLYQYRDKYSLDVDIEGEFFSDTISGLIEGWVTEKMTEKLKEAGSKALEALPYMLMVANRFAIYAYAVQTTLAIPHVLVDIAFMAVVEVPKKLKELGFDFEVPTLTKVKEIIPSAVAFFKKLYELGAEKVEGVWEYLFEKHPEMNNPLHIDGEAGDELPGETLWSSAKTFFCNVFNVQHEWGADDILRSKRLRAMSSSLRSFKDLGEAITSIMTEIGKFLSGFVPQDPDVLRQEIEKWLEEYNTLITEPVNLDNVLKYKSLWKRSHTLLATWRLYEKQQGDHLPPAVLKAITNVQALSTKIEALLKTGKIRAEPIGIALYGGAGTAKTALTSLLSTFMVRDVMDEINDDEVAQRVYYRKALDERWDGYNNDTIVVCYDDAFMDKTQDKVTQQVTEICSVINSSPFFPPMADLADKGVTVVQPEMVIVNSNMELAPGFVSRRENDVDVAKINQPDDVKIQKYEAFLRRFELIIEPTFKDASKMHELHSVLQKENVLSLNTAANYLDYNVISCRGLLAREFIRKRPEDPLTKLMRVRDGKCTIGLEDLLRFIHGARRSNISNALSTIKNTNSMVRDILQKMGNPAEVEGESGDISEAPPAVWKLIYDGVDGTTDGYDVYHIKIPGWSFDGLQIALANVGTKHLSYDHETQLWTVDLGVLASFSFSLQNARTFFHHDMRGVHVKSEDKEVFIFDEGQIPYCDTRITIVEPKIHFIKRPVFNMTLSKIRAFASNLKDELLFPKQSGAVLLEALSPQHWGALQTMSELKLVTISVLKSGNQVHFSISWHHVPYQLSADQVQGDDLMYAIFQKYKEEVIVEPKEEASYSNLFPDRPYKEEFRIKPIIRLGIRATILCTLIGTAIGAIVYRIRRRKKWRALVDAESYQGDNVANKSPMPRVSAEMANKNASERLPGVIKHNVHFLRCGGTTVYGLEIHDGWTATVNHWLVAAQRDSTENTIVFIDDTRVLLSSLEIIRTKSDLVFIRWPHSPARSVYSFLAKDEDWNDTDVLKSLHLLKVDGGETRVATLLPMKNAMMESRSYTVTEGESTIKYHGLYGRAIYDSHPGMCALPVINTSAHVQRAIVGGHFGQYNGVGYFFPLSQELCNKYLKINQPKTDVSGEMGFAGRDPEALLSHEVPTEHLNPGEVSLGMLHQKLKHHQPCTTDLIKSDYAKDEGEETPNVPAKLRPFELRGIWRDPVNYYRSKTYVRPFTVSENTKGLMKLASEAMLLEWPTPHEFNVNLDNVLNGKGMVKPMDLSHSAGFPHNVNSKFKMKGKSPLLHRPTEGAPIKLNDAFKDYVEQYIRDAEEGKSLTCVYQCYYKDEKLDRDAVYPPAKRHFVVAGPGTGKTTFVQNTTLPVYDIEDLYPISPAIGMSFFDFVRRNVVQEKIDALPEECVVLVHTAQFCNEMGWKIAGLVHPSEEEWLKRCDDLEPVRCSLANTYRAENLRLLPQNGFLARSVEQAVKNCICSSKIRMFYSVPVEFTILTRYCIFEWLDAIRRQAPMGPCMVGVNANSTEWSVMAHVLYPGNQHKNTICGDYKGYDINVRVEVRESVWNAIGRWYDVHKIWRNKEHKKMFDVLRQAALRPLYSFRGQLFSVPQSRMPSGLPLVAEENCCTNLVMSTVAFICLAYPHLKGSNSTKIMESLKIWKRDIGKVFYGDDHLLTVPDQYDWFNQVSFGKALGDIFKMPYTTATKQDVSELYTPEGEVTFLKRNFCKMGGMVFGQLPLDVVTDIPRWIRRKSGPAILAIRQNMEAALAEMFVHGKQTFDEYKDKYNRYLISHQAAPIGLTYEVAKDRYFLI